MRVRGGERRRFLDDPMVQGWPYTVDEGVSPGFSGRMPSRGAQIAEQHGSGNHRTSLGRQGGAHHRMDTAGASRFDGGLAAIMAQRRSSCEPAAASSEEESV